MEMDLTNKTKFQKFILKDGVILFYLLVIVLAVIFGIDMYRDRYVFYIEEESIIMKLDSDYKIEITPKYYEYGNDNINYIWESTDNEIASVTEEGIITASKLGEAKINIKSKKGNNKKTIIVNVLDMDIESVSFGGTIGITEKESQRLSPLFNNNSTVAATLNYYSHDESIAVVDKYGNVTGVSNGTTVITATAPNGVSGDCEVNVVGIKVDPIEITFDKNNITIDKGESSKITATINPIEATDKSIKWKSSNNKVATVNTEGIVNGISAGTATITATTSNGKKVTCNVEVKEKNIEVEAIAIDITNFGMTVGGSSKLNAIITPDNASNKNIKWRSSNDKVVSVDKNGNIKAKGIGEATITVTSSNNKEATSKITVKEEVIAIESITFNTKKLEMTEGEESHLNISITPEGSTYKKITWNSSNSNVATVDSNGYIKAVGAGEAVITATSDNGKQTTCEIKVKAKIIAVNFVTLSTTSKTIYEGANFQLYASINPENASNKSVSWSSSNNEIVSVDSNGKVTGKRVGEAVITVTTNNGKTSTCTIKVKSNTITVTSIGLNINNKTINQGEKFTLTATINPSNATDKSIKWSSSNGNIASVDANGVVTGINSGTATITATTNNGKTSTCNVTVNIPDPGRMELLKDTNFNNGMEFWIDANEGSYKCVNCSGTQYWRIATWDFGPKFNNSYFENGAYYVNAVQPDGTNNKLVSFNNAGYVSLALNTFSENYSDSSVTGWPHLLLDGPNGTGTIEDFNSFNELEKKYYSFKGNDIWYHVDVKLDYYTKGNPINGISAAQYLSYVVIRDKVTKRIIWFGFNLFDDRSDAQGNYSALDVHTNSYIYTLGTDTIYNGMGNSIYNNGNFSYAFRTVNINISNYINDIISFANEKQLFGRNITEDDLFVSGMNIGFEIHGEYHIGATFKDLRITSIKR